jgi:hypothetical protein
VDAVTVVVALGAAALLVTTRINSVWLIAVGAIVGIAWRWLTA